MPKGCSQVQGFKARSGDLHMCVCVCVFVCVSRLWEFVPSQFTEAGSHTQLFLPLANHFFLLSLTVKPFCLDAAGAHGILP